MDLQSWWDIIIEFEDGLWKSVAALALVAIAVLLSYQQHLDLQTDMVVSIARAFLQLSILGFVLNFIFVQDGWRGYLAIFAAFCFMVVVAGITAGKRASSVPKSTQIACISIFCGAAFTFTVLVGLQIFEPIPRFLIPVLGMMVGNAMSVSGVAMKRFHEDMRQNVNLIEAALALGATPHQAILLHLRRSLVLALAPVLDTTKTVGLISLPGAMTGLIMGGASPFEATKLQIVVMNMLIACTTFSSILCVLLLWPQYFTRTYQIRYELLRNKG